MDAVGPKPTAATQGTTLTVEDLFHSVPLRKKVCVCVCVQGDGLGGADGPLSGVSSYLGGRGSVPAPHMLVLPS